MVLCALANQVLLVAASWIASITAWDTTNQMRVDLTEKILGLGHDFHRNHTTGELV